MGRDFARACDRARGGGGREYRVDDYGLSLTGFADALVACAGHAEADALLEVIDNVACSPRYGDLISLVDAAPLIAGVGQS
jgi:hypothetical protein